MKIVFFGSSQSSLHSFQLLSSVGLAVELIITQPDRKAGRGKKITQNPLKKYALENNTPILQPHKIRKNPEVLEKLQQIKPDLNVIVSYGQFIPSSIIYLPKYNSINLHFSLLPKYRGASPVQWAILKGEEKTGVSIFELNKNMDEGPVYSQKEVPIQADENAAELESRLAHIGAELLITTINKIPVLKLRPQDHSKATYAPLIKKQMGKICWENSGISIHRQYRAFYSWPSTFTFLQDKRLKIIKGKPFDKKSGLNYQPGEIIEINRMGIKVCCGDSNSYLIEELQPENKKEMSAYAYSLGAKLQTGDIFS